jgi:hypothetical protein
MIGTPSYKAAGCGCGSGGTLSASPCGCGGAQCDSCQGQGIARPRFFAGQLLTEDDLQLLADYVGHKNRLHNRHLFGAGVVCGLEVTCHPCGDGRVIVHPGYALDCCGNDLTLSCAQTLDLNSMIRDLRRDQLGGFDCGDPCAEPDTRAASTNANGYDDRQGVAAAKKELRYCLYLRYCEQAADPVMPYSTGDDCGRADCEPTRVREGVKFELRCQPTGDAANPLLARLCACLGDFSRVPAVYDALRRLHHGGRIVTATGTPVEGDFSSAQRIAPDVNRYEQYLQRRGSSGGKGGTTANDPQSQWLAVEQWENPDVAFTLGRMSMYVEHYDNIPSPEQQRLSFDDQQVLGRARTYITQTVTSVVANSAADFRLVRDWLVERLDNAPYITDCTLRQKVSAMELPAYRGRPGDYETQAYATSVRTLTEYFLGFVRDCICRALNPACLPCDDTGVLLACIDLSDCQVVKVCNMERSFVMSPAAVRYWLPPLQLLGNLLERLCCDPLSALINEKADNTIDLGIGRLDIGSLFKSEIVRILDDSLCLTRKGQSSLMMSYLDEAFARTKARSVQDSKADASATVGQGQETPQVELRERARADEVRLAETPAVPAARVPAARVPSSKKAARKTRNAPAPAPPAEAKKNGGTATSATNATNATNATGSVTNGVEAAAPKGEEK